MVGCVCSQGVDSEMPVAIKPAPVTQAQGPLEAATFRWRKLLQVAGCALLMAAVMAVAILHQAEILNLLATIGDKLNKEKYDPRVIAASLVISALLYAVPLPGKPFWMLLVGFMYGWHGLGLLVFGRGCGSLAAFVGARRLWHLWEPSRCNLCRGCVGCGAKSETAKLLLLVRAIEDVPFKTILLIGLSPSPTILVAYLLGAKAHSLRWWQFSIPMTLSGVKLAVPIFHATQLKTIHEVSLGSPGGKDSTVVAVISIVCGILAALLIAYACRRQLGRIQQQYSSSDEAAKGPTSAV